LSTFHQNDSFICYLLYDHNKQVGTFKINKFPLLHQTFLIIIVYKKGGMRLYRPKQSVFSLLRSLQEFRRASMKDNEQQ